MTTVLTPTASPALAAAEDRHTELQARLTAHAEALLAAVAARAPYDAARRELVGFLRTELLLHAEAEEALLYVAVRTDATALLVRAMHDQHRMLCALVDEIEHAATGLDVAVATGALVVLCDVRMEQENRHLLPALAAAGLDLADPVRPAEGW